MEGIAGEMTLFCWYDTDLLVFHKLDMNMSSWTLGLVDEFPHERKPYVDVSYGRDPPPLDELDTHIDTLLLECSKQFEEEQLKQQSSNVIINAMHVSKS